MILEKILQEDMPMPYTEMWKSAVEEYVKAKSYNDAKFGAIYLCGSDSDTPKPDNTGVVVVRALLADPKGKINKEKKYILLQTYENTGDLSTIDIVNLPLDYHKQIFMEYLSNVMPPTLLNMPKWMITGDGSSRYFICGGISVEKRNMIEFDGSSGDFGKYISIYSSNDIAAFLTKEIGFNAASKDNNIESGREYIEKCISLMAKNKHKKDFYEELTNMYILQPMRSKTPIIPKTYYSLVIIKAMDRVANEGIDPIQAITEEATEGIAREIIMKTTAENILSRRE